MFVILKYILSRQQSNRLSSQIDGFCFSIQFFLAFNLLTLCVCSNCAMLLMEEALHICLPLWWLLLLFLLRKLYRFGLVSDRTQPISKLVTVIRLPNSLDWMKMENPLSPWLELLHRHCNIVLWMLTVAYSSIFLYLLLKDFLI